MATWKFVISDPGSRRSVQKEVEQSKATILLGKKIGDDFLGDSIDLTGYNLQITGGTDKDGFPIHPSVEGMGRRRVLLSGKPGFHPKLKGQRKRKTVRGNTISADIMQINCKVVKTGEKSFDQLFPKKEKPKEEKPAEKPKEEKKEEVKEEKPKEEAKPAEEPKAEEPKKEEKPTEPKQEKVEEVKNEEKKGGEGSQD